MIGVKRPPDNGLRTYQAEIWSTAVEADVPIVTHHKESSVGNRDRAEGIEFRIGSDGKLVTHKGLTQNLTVEKNLLVFAFDRIASDRNDPLHYENICAQIQSPPDDHHVTSTLLMLVIIVHINKYTFAEHDRWLHR